MGRPREHSDETRERILAAAIRLLAEEGPSGVTMRRVADDADTTTRAIYTLFGGREGLFKQLFHDFAAMITRYHEAVAPSDDAEEEMLALAAAYRRAAVEQPHGYHLFFAGAPGFVPDREDRRVAQRSFDRVIASFERWGEQGRLGGRQPRAVALQMWALVHGLTSLELTGRLGSRGDADERWRDAVATAFHGYVATRPA